MYNSECVALNNVKFPEFHGERHYMVKFFKDQGLPSQLTRYQDSVDAMLLNIDVQDNPIFITIDEKLISKGDSHRRGGIHIDGYWIEELHAHRGGGHRMNANGWDTGGGRWNDKGDFVVPESIVLASSVSTCKGWVGKYDGIIGDKGDCAHIDTSNMKSFMLDENIVYRGNVMFVHESMPVEYDTERTLIRLNIKNC